jgi:hypothetical protein
MIIQQPQQLKDSLRWRMVETSDEDSTIFNELCPCTLGHSHEFEAVRCAKLQERINNPVERAKAFETTKCYGCKYFGHAQEPTKFIANTNEVKGVFHGTLFRQWCEHPDNQTEADDYNEVYSELDGAECRCADQEWEYFEAK